MKKTLLKTLVCLIPVAGFSQTTLLSENFESGSIPSTWTVQQTNTVETWGVEQGTTSYVASVNYDESLGQQNEWLITPSLDLTATLNYKFSAEVGLSYYWAVDPEDNYDAFVKISTDGGSSWTQIWSENNLGVFTNWIMNPISIDLSSYSGNSNVKLAFQYVGADGAALYVDNVKVVGSTPPTSAPNCATLSSPANGATNLAYLSVPLSWTAPSSGATVDSYDVYLDKNPDPTTLVTNVTGTTYTAANLDASSTYYWKVVPKNSAGSATGCTVYSFTTMAPTYCTAGATSTSFEKISNVTFANINQNSTATAGYEDFTSTIGNVTAGQTYTFTASFTGTSYDQDHVLVWIDFNNDKDFNDAGEQVLVTATKKSPWTGSITIPAGATATTTRMRVRLNDSGSSTSNITPCGTSTFGQVEDYTLNIASLAVSDVNKADNIKAYPNPVKDILKLEAQGKIKSVKVFDTAGKQIMTKELNEAKSQIDLSKLGTGVYVVTATLADGTTTSTKVIKE